MLREKGNDEAADRLASIGRDWQVTITYQDEPRGLGHAVGCARKAVGDRPFAVLLPDELMGDSSLLAHMNGVCARTGGSVVGVKQVPRPGELVRRARPGGADRRRRRDPRRRPGRGSRAGAPSDYILIGRYVLTPDVFDEIERLAGSGGELQLTGALRAQAKRYRSTACSRAWRRHRQPDRLPRGRDRVRPPRSEHGHAGA